MQSPDGRFIWNGYSWAPGVQQKTKGVIFLVVGALLSAYGVLNVAVSDADPSSYCSTDACAAGYTVGRLLPLFIGLLLVAIGAFRMLRSRRGR
jgi:hypothetical protein